MSRIEERYTDVLAKIEAARTQVSGPPVTLVAVSKYQPLDAMEQLYRLGHRDFGENYVQDLVQKAAEMKNRGCRGIRWHFIGHLQTNKAKTLADQVDVVHSIDSVKTGLALARRWVELGKETPLSVFLQVNIDREPTKTGMDPSMARAVAEELSRAQGLRVEGLMCIPAPDGDRGADAFSRLKGLRGELGSLTRGKLSMGMSQDYEQAIACGSTHVRVGTLIFGERK